MYITAFVVIWCIYIYMCVYARVLVNGLYTRYIIRETQT